VPKSALSRTGAILLVIVGLTYAIDFAFPTDILAPGEPPKTTVGMIHLADAFLGWILFVVAAFLISGRLEHAAAWNKWRPLALILSWLALVLLVLLVAVVVSKQPVGGLVEKSFILDRNVWSLLLAIFALRLPAGDDRPSS